MEATNAEKSISLDYLPMALWTQILFFLPAKSLLILRCVCRFFLTIIDDPFFVSLHIRHFPPNHNQTRILTLEVDDTDIQIYSRATCDCDVGFGFTVGCELFEVGPPSHSKKWIERDSFFDGHWFVAGSVDGLILLADEFLHAALWNPSIRKLRRIPHPSPSNPASYENSIIKLGLGYDVSCDDYKVLALMDPTLNEVSSSYEAKHRQAAAGSYVYSVKTRSWAKGELPDRRFKREASQSVSFEGGLVWIEGVETSEGFYHQLVRFDFATNTFVYSWMPYPIKNNLWYKSRLVMIDGGSSLGVWGLDSGNLVSLWAMDESAKSSWIRLYKFGEGVLRVGCFWDMEMVWEYWTKEDKPKVSLYDGDDEEGGSRYPTFRYMGVYVESLVLLN